jgi:hypothetical protein
MEFQNHTPVKYDDLTQAQKKEICNGCGGKGGFVKPPHSILFKPVCDPHDYDYWSGCSWWDKIKADWKMHQGMKKAVKKMDIQILRDHLYFNESLLPDWAVRQIYYRWADAYFAGVSVAGKLYFYFDKNKRYPCMK